ncbi:MAG TPA: ATP synthase F1 subunit gamma [Syntrophales bacterium]|jgi:F-type H+-transporting ATPase subunit gamma|nr:ATP synthase F1 subunit gamma [Syntrophales bacterium]HOU76727.1 ATP synthase F1 subunit gamma [Syntrophales bacterium]HPC31850.1 ATP synthase F1 subunit gamma [Syntrophales bacterium]HQG33459.1 ATP synthase F1 subunit gamma [Syntrophales bacterium]HQI34685.1 ATP synthase F1 subunit gamma [Syntrophales bacterium]
MAALKDIKRQIAAVQKTKQITKAMNMVAASKFRTAQMRMENFRPYAGKFMEVLNSLALRVDASSHPLLAVRPPKKLRVICMTSDRGLCGGFNTNIIKATERFVKEKLGEGKEVTLVPVGRKGRDYFRKKAKIMNERVDVFKKFDMSLAVEISNDIIPSFIKEEYDELYLVYNEYRNVSVQKPAVVRLFPLPSIGQEEATDPEKRIDYIYEPSDEVLLDRILPMYVRVLIYRALLETYAGENGARMAAMDNATRNCEDLIGSLSLKFNKARQAAITAELMDIVGGTEALAKG